MVPEHSYYLFARHLESTAMTFSWEVVAAGILATSLLSAIGGGIARRLMQRGVDPFLDRISSNRRQHREIKETLAEVAEEWAPLGEWREAVDRKLDHVIELIERLHPDK